MKVKDLLDELLIVHAEDDDEIVIHENNRALFGVHYKPFVKRNEVIRDGHKHGVIHVVLPELRQGLVEVKTPSTGL